MKIINKFKSFILIAILTVISVICIIANGNTYTIEVNDIRNISNVEDLDVNIEDENVVKCIEKRVENNTVKIKIESISKGKTYVSCGNGEQAIMFSIYVHNFGIITFNEYMGDSNGGIIVPILMIIFSIYLLYIFINLYKKSKNESLYQYKNIAYLGIIIFLEVSIISQFMAISKYTGLISTVQSIANMFSFTTLLFPIVLIVSILIIISNILLIWKEGFRVKNILGIILGGILCISTILPEIIYKILYSATWIDIHNQNGAGVYIYNLVEAIINITITYIECILIGTIIMSIKAAKHIPKFDKDCIIVLGCQIKKDGTLTKLLEGRVDRAIEFWKMQKEKTGKDIIFVTSGGKGNDEIISEGQAMKNYLLEQGIDKDKILVEDKSNNTYENIKFSNNIIKEKIKNAKIAFSTTNYHVFRAGCIASEQNLKYEGIGAKTKSYFWINAFIREFIATLANEKKKHIIVILAIILIVILMILVTYLNNNI